MKSAAETEQSEEIQLETWSDPESESTCSRISDDGMKWTVIC